MPRKKRESLTVLSYSAGQDSQTILYLLLFDKKFRKQWAPNNLLVMMSDTGNEHPETVWTMVQTLDLCDKHNVPFVFVEPSLGFHTEAWRSVPENWERTSTVGMKSMRKICTVNVKINPFYKALNWWVANHFGDKDDALKRGKPALKKFAAEHGKIDVLIGLTAEETRRLDDKQYAAWMEETIQRRYPLMEIGLTRQGCQNCTRQMGFDVPMPSNCMFCPYAAPIEVLWLARKYPYEFDRWVELERNKIEKFRHLKDKNHGVFGKRLLRDVLLGAEKKFGHLSLSELTDAKMNHGHCVKTGW
jgi:3'-phosphoadenosine 5'-phosphosulfate sulfotransferase (PAPS reductase)/FAD synthetase